MSQKDPKTTTDDFFRYQVDDLGLFMTFLGAKLTIWDFL